MKWQIVANSIISGILTTIGFFIATVIWNFLVSQNVTITEADLHVAGFVAFFSVLSFYRGATWMEKQ